MAGDSLQHICKCFSCSFANKNEHINHLRYFVFYSGSQLLQDNF
jgi:hypothetical protein